MLQEQSWPPKCCLTEVPLKLALLALNSKERGEYKEKAAEYAVPAGNRLYCPGTKCHKFVHPSKITSPGSVLKCPHCSLKICRMCRGEAHGQRQDCPEDFGLTATLEAAMEESWQRCFSCRAMVELASGCRHITCKCRAEFCYVCGLKWRTCACTDTDLANRRAEGTRRRTQRVQRSAARDAAALTEERAIGRAIAEVAEFERNQVDIRAAAQREAERQHREDEELLAHIAVLSAEEERQRIEIEAFEEALAEKVQQDVLRTSVVDHIHLLYKHLESLVTYQQQALISRHDNASAGLRERAATEQEAHSNESKTLTTMLTSNAEKRRKAMTDRHDRELATLRTEHQRREDAMFLQTQTHIQDKPNRFDRQKWLQNTFLRQLEEEREEQTVRHSVEHMRFETQLQNDNRGLERAHAPDTRIIENRHEKELRSLDNKIRREQQYFDFILVRRKRLVEFHAAQLLADVEASRDPQELLREMAISNLPPFPPVDVVSGADVIPAVNIVPAPDVDQIEQTNPVVAVKRRSPLMSQPSSSVEPPRTGHNEQVQVSSSVPTSPRLPEITDVAIDENSTRIVSCIDRTTMSSTKRAERRKSSVWNVFGW
jgi:hypothetical protein